MTRKLASGGAATETVVPAHHYDALKRENAELRAAISAHNTRELALIHEVANLRHDIARHVQIAADQATEIAELKRTTIKLTPVELQSGLDRVRFAELLIKQLPETHEGRNTWLLNYSPNMADKLKQRLKLAENLRGRTRVEGEEVGAPHLRED